MPFRSALLSALIASGLVAQSSEFPVSLNLPTTEGMQFWDAGLLFTHRFALPVQGNGKDAYGLDGHAWAGLGLALGIKPVKGLNLLLYRTADHKTFTLGLQQELLNKTFLRLALRGERFDEVLQERRIGTRQIGITGFAFQVPAEFFLGDSFVLSAVPTFLSRSSTQDKGLFNLGLGLRAFVSPDFSFQAEYYPRPSKIASRFKPGWAAGFTYKTQRHRFTFLGTNSTGTTANQVLSGDFANGPGVYGDPERPKGSWSLGFNLARVF